MKAIGQSTASDNKCCEFKPQLQKSEWYYGKVYVSIYAKPKNSLGDTRAIYTRILYNEFTLKTGAFMFPWEYLFVFLGFLTVFGTLVWLSQKPILRFYNKYFGFTAVGTSGGDDLLEQQLDEFFARNKQLFDQKFNRNHSDSPAPKNPDPSTELTCQSTPNPHISPQEKFLGIILADLTLTSEKSHTNSDPDTIDIDDFN
jgi:hypothetical protein